MNQYHPISSVILPFLNFKGAKTQLRVKKQPCDIRVKTGHRDSVRPMLLRTEPDHMSDEKACNASPPGMGSCQHIADGADAVFPAVKISKTHNMT
jgi:hypothetical protein